MSYILVLDDDLEFARKLSGILEAAGLPSEVTQFPEEALRHVKEQSVKLVVADYEMPGMNGADFLARARVLKPDLPVIIVSGRMATADMVRVANMGVTFVMEKPVSREAFLYQVERFLRVSPHRVNEASTSALNGVATALSDSSGSADSSESEAPGKAIPEVPSGDRGLPAYPPLPPLFVVASKSTRKALEEIWKLSQSERIFAVVHDDSLCRVDLAGVIASWLGSGHPLARFYLNPFAGAARQEDLRAVLKSGSPVLVIIPMDTPGDSKAFGEWLGSINGLVGSSGSPIVLMVSPSARGMLAVESLEDELCPVVVFPPIEERLSDLASMFAHVWNRHRDGELFPPDLGRALLACAWKKFPGQLAASLRRLEGVCRRYSGQWEASLCESVLPGGESEGGLDHILKSAQTNYLSRVLDGSPGSLERAASATGIPLATLQNVCDPAELPLQLARWIPEGQERSK